MTRTALTPLIVALVAGTGLLATAGCAGHPAPASAARPGEASVGWVIMHGPRDNPDEQFGCQSEPRTDCSLEASATGNQALSAVYLYFHPATAETTYTGVVRVGFLSDGATSAGIRPNVTVKPGEVGKHSVIGLVTDKPGRFKFTVDMTAVMQGGGTQHIQDEITVVVTPRAVGAVASAATTNH